MKTEVLQAAVAHGKAYARKLTRIHRLVVIPDQNFAAVIIDPDGRYLDWESCKRLSRPEAHRAVNSVLDAPRAFKQFYNGLIDGTEGGAE